jgi:hypothetical protein
MVDITRIAATAIRNASPIRLIRSESPEAQVATGMRKTSRHDAKAAGLQPPTIAVSDRARAYLAHELEAVAAARAAAATDAQVRELVRRLVDARADLLTQRAA